LPLRVVDFAAAKSATPPNNQLAFAAGSKPRTNTVSQVFSFAQHARIRFSQFQSSGICQAAAKSASPPDNQLAFAAGSKSVRTRFRRCLVSLSAPESVFRSFSHPAPARPLPKVPPLPTISPLLPPAVNLYEHGYAGV
jgi:hypothetical protein